MQRLRVRTKAPRSEYEIKIGFGVIENVGNDARRWLGPHARRIAVISNKTVFEIYGQLSVLSLRTAGFEVSSCLLRDGEQAKSLNSIQNLISFLSNENFERSDGILALGGGVVGDVAGFAAAIYLRGLPFIQVPTTLLAQIDSAVGGKTAVNLKTGKNLVGAFHQPAGVLSDVRTLQSLPRRELVAGLCECVKQGVVSGKPLFNQTRRVLGELNSSSVTLMSLPLVKMIAAHCAFKAAVVKGDEREDRDRSDRRSRRILNFGHTAGHALEAVTRYKRFRHGEAVGVGMLVAGELSKHLGMLPAAELELLREAVRQCGRLPRTDDLDENDILEAIAHDKKSVSGSVQWVLLEGIGRPRIVSGKEFARRDLKLALRRALKMEVAR